MHITAELIRSAIAGCRDVPHPSAIDSREARPAGVVVPVTLGPDACVHVVLRGAHLKDHAGEVGFPGGKPEVGDADLQATALREAGEEVGLAPGDLTWLGKLTPCPVITGRYVIHPFVAAVAEGASLRVASGEIARTMSLPIVPMLRGDLLIHAVKGEWHGETVITPHFALDGAVLYGASAYILYELLACIATELGIVLPAPVLDDVLPWGNRYPIR